MGKQNNKKVMQSKDGRKLNRQNTRRLTRGNSPKVERQEKEIADTAMRLSTGNPFSPWYDAFPGFTNDVATLAFGVPVGQAVNVQGQDWVAADGIMGLYFTPSIGVSKDMTSPINRQAVRIFSYLRSVQRAAASYDSADLMMYLLGIDSLYTYWAFLRRVYGIAQLFTPINKYYPRRLLHMMGIDDGIVNNLADFRAYINRFALNIGRFTMPLDFDITARHMWMTTGLYVDSNTRRAQTYAFIPYALYVWDNTVTTGSKLTAEILVEPAYVAAGSNRLNLSQLIAFGEKLIKNFDNDDDTMAISGDLYRAYGDKVMHVEETPSGYAIAPVYDEQVLSQIENSIISGFFKDGGQAGSFLPSITQDPSVNSGAIIFNPYCSFGGQTNIGDATTPLYGRNYAAISQNAVLNSHKDTPTPEDVMEMTRLQTRAAANTPPTTAVAATGVEVAQSGADIINECVICAPGRSSRTAVSFIRVRTNTIWCNAQGQPFDDDAASLIAHMMQFDWAPMLYLVLWNGSSSDLQTIAGDLDNFTVASFEQMYNIHEAAMLSLLDVPAPTIK